MGREIAKGVWNKKTAFPDEEATALLVIQSAMFVKKEKQGSMEPA
jgi:hypothetical protein